MGYIVQRFRKMILPSTRLDAEPHGQRIQQTLPLMLKEKVVCRETALGLLHRLVRVDGIGSGHGCVKTR